MRRMLVTAIAFVLAGAGSVFAAAPQSTAPVVRDATTQLPRNVRPTHYDVAVVPPDAPRKPGWMRLVLVSDTHNVDLPVSLFPPGDLLVHAGDHTTDGLPGELEGAAAWLRSLAPRYTHGVVAIAGNHDKPLDTETWPSAAPHLQPGEPSTEAAMACARSLFDDGPRADGTPAPLRLLDHAASCTALRVCGLMTIPPAGAVGTYTTTVNGSGGNLSGVERRACDASPAATWACPRGRASRPRALVAAPRSPQGPARGARRLG